MNTLKIIWNKIKYKLIIIGAILVAVFGFAFLFVKFILGRSKDEKAFNSVSESVKANVARKEKKLGEIDKQISDLKKEKEKKQKEAAKAKGSKVTGTLNGLGFK